jgi:hypothetical protein
VYTKAFSPTGKTILVVAAVSAPTGVQCPEIGTTSGYQFRIHNAGTTLAFLSFGATAGEAQSNAVIPTGTPQNSIALPAGIVEILSFPIGSFFSAIISASTANIYITPGKGI